MSRTKAIFAGLLAGLLAALVMTTAMFLLAMLRVATAAFLAITFRLHSAGTVSLLMGKVGGYNHLKQLGVGSTIAGQLLVGAIVALFSVCLRDAMPAASRRFGRYQF